jgi:hypothetical protein
MKDIPAKDLKARTVARGDLLKLGEHYDETAAPVVHTAVIKMMLAISVQKGLRLFHGDVSGAFYGNPMDRKGVVVRLPVGFDPYSAELRELDAPPLYGELRRALPGIPQGSLVQYDQLLPDVERIGFTRAASDPCLFLQPQDDMAMVLHVDDFILACRTEDQAVQVFGRQGIGSSRKIKWGPLRRALGVDFEVDYRKDERSVFMSQRTYGASILERAGMSECTAAPTPAIAGRRYSKQDSPTSDEEKQALEEAGMTREAYRTLTASLPSHERTCSSCWARWPSSLITLDSSTGRP